MSDGILRFSNAEGVTALNRYHNFLTNYGDFGALQRISYISTPPGSSNTDITSIPNTFQDLYLVGSVLTSATNTATAWWFRLNGDGGANYSMTELTGNGSSASSNRSSNNTILSGSGPTIVSGIPAVFQMWILNYKNTSTFKTVLWRTANDNNGSGWSQINIGLYRSTAAISQINILFPGGNSLTQNHTLSLYGVRASAA